LLILKNMLGRVVPHRMPLVLQLDQTKYNR
jgi:hypothetical protein